MVEVAHREWHTYALVRFLQDYTCTAVEGRFQEGQELHMVQGGRAGLPVDRAHWCTDFAIDGAFIVPAAVVEVVEVLEEVPPN